MADEYGKMKDSEMSLQEEHRQSLSGTEKRSNSPVSSCASLKSDNSMAEPLTFKGGSGHQEGGTEKRSNSPVSSCASLKSDNSMAEPLTFKGGSGHQEGGTEKRSKSPVSSGVSLKSDNSMAEPLTFKVGSAPQESETEKRSNSPVSSHVSLNSDHSKTEPLTFKVGSAPQESGTEKRSNSPVSSFYKSGHSVAEPLTFKEGSAPQERPEERSISPISSLSMKSDQSMDEILTFTEGSAPQESNTDPSVSSQEPMRKKQAKNITVHFTKNPISWKRKNSESPGHIKLSPTERRQNSESPGRSTTEGRDHKGSESTVKNRKLQKKRTDFLYNIFNDLQKKIFVFIKHELKMYKNLLRKENTNYYGDMKEEMWNLREGVLTMTLFFLKMMEHEDLAEALQDDLIGFQQRTLKSNLSKKCKHVYEGIARQGDSKNLDDIYTDLYITEGGQGNKEHEIGRIENNNAKKNANQMEQEKQIRCNTMFEPSSEQDKPIRTVITQGVAGMGKSICVQKFILDWAEGEEYQDIKFIFPLPFRELNLKKENQSLMDIIYFFFPETQGLRFSDKYKVMFIFDGLDECQLPLAFHENATLYNASTSAPLDVVMTNLIKGNLLPSALIWITTRPAAASKIRAEFIDRVTELRGFSDEQKDEYFRKRINDQNQANKIIKHIRESRSLHIMCHIPVFCWISATVLQKILEGSENKETPKTLTEMYACFLIFQAVQGNVKYSGKNALDTPWDKKGILSLGKLAFQHLEENSLIFYTGHLEACGIDPSKMSVYSGLCTQETVRFLGTVYSFVHLSIQEFLAALFAYISLRNEDKNVLDKQSTSLESNKPKVIDLLKTAVDKALKSDHGHLDLFLRFLLGLSLESNERLIRDLLKETGDNSTCQKDIVEYIKLMFKQNPSPERSINLFYCLNELNDDSLVKEIQSYMSSGCLSEAELSPAQWSALVFVLLTSKEKLEVFELQNYIRSDECLIRLLPVVKNATAALLSKCNLTERSCSALCKVLSSESCSLTRIDMSSNAINDKGMEMLSARLKSPNCKLKKLSLSFCSITEKGYAALASALESNPSSHLEELELRGNDPGDTGVQLLTVLQKDPKCKLKTLSLLKSDAAEKAYASLTETLGKNPLLLRELDLSGKIQGGSGMKQLSALLEDSHCRPKTLSLIKSSIREKDCADLSSALYSNPSHLIELDLSENKLRNSGVKEFCALLKNQNCKLQKLGLSFCSITEEGYAALASALTSNPSSHLIELDLRGNDPGNTGVKLLTDLLGDPKCSLKTIRLLKSADAEKVYASLTETLGKNPLLLRELDLSGKIQGDSGMKQLSALLEDLHCRPEKLKLNKSSITKEGCSALSSALCSNLSHLRELDLSENKLGNFGVKKICDVLMNSHCELDKLGLSDCCVTEEGYIALASALKSNCSSHLIKLDLRGNDPGDTGVELLTNLQKHQQRKMTLRLLKSDAAEEAFASLTKTLGENPLLLTELDLSGKIQEDSGMKQLSALLEDLHCRPTKLKLDKSSITEEGCRSLSSALCSNPSHLRELDLSKNKLGNSGVKHICSLLNNQCCKLQKLKLSFCNVTKKGYAALASALKSSHLIELDLRGNDPGDTGVKLLTDLPEDPNCKLKTIRLLKRSTAEEVCDSLTKVLGINPLLQRELDLSGKIQGDSKMKQISNLLEDLHCRTKKLKLNKNSITEEGCAALSSAFCSNPSHLIELDLSENKLGNTGVKHICIMLTNSHMKLQKLGFSSSNITEDGYVALASALKSNHSSHLIELDLRGNDPGEKGVELLTDLLQDSNCKLTTLRLLKSDAAESACTYLTEALGINVLLLRDMDLSGKIQGDSGIKQLSAVLEDLHCRPNKLKLNSSNITDCTALVSALRLNPSHLIELDLSDNKFGNFGVQQICPLLKYCKLQILGLSFCSITEEGYAALASALKSNPSSHLIQLDLRGNDPGESGVELLTNLLENPKYSLKTIRFLSTPAAEHACASLTKILKRNPLLLKDLDMSQKMRGDSDVDQLCSLLEDSHFKIKELRLNKCNLTKESCLTLACILNLDSTVRKIDLSNNDLQDTGMQCLAAGLKNPKCKLEILMLSKCELTAEGCSALAEVLNCLYPHLKELDLSNNNLQDSGVVQLTAGLKNPMSTLKIMRLSNCSITEKGCAAVASALGTNPSHLIELDLCGNKIGHSGVKQLSDLLKNTNCILQKLIISYNNIQEKGYADLASALQSNPSSHLIELDLRGNDPGDKGVKLLTNLQKHQQRKMTLRLLKSSAAEEACNSLTKTLQANPLLLSELDLSGKMKEDSGLKQLSALLEDSHCRPKKLKLNNSNITEEGCATLASALGSNPSHLTELDLSGNKLGESGIKHLCSVLENTQFKLWKLQLSNCSVTEEACAALSSALKSNPSHLGELDLTRNEVGNSGVKQLAELLKNSLCTVAKLNLRACCLSGEGYAALALALQSNCSSHLIELDLRENDPGDKGVQLLTDLQKNPKCKLILRFLNSDAAEKACAYLSKVLGKNPLLVRDLDLSGKIQGDAGIKQLSDLLRDSHCILKTLKLNNMSITQEGCSALATALFSNPSHLTELDLSGNEIGNSGVEKLSDLLKNAYSKLTKLMLVF
ncbi:protein NLRC5-like isoform X2 [Colossoma macropomum]|uniref:protein NLRC5-like isoform X2 n=1 Tax=Colossoma macropomum TaxID=42526 RepID=UPI001864C1FB|nr:protein NLRC5-like isoform X2 [Colossoma macropomum]